VIARCIKLFHCVSVAEELLRKKTICYKNDEILVSRYDPVTRQGDATHLPADVSAATAADATACDQPDLILVKVSDIPLEMSKDVVRMLFENKRYGGGDIKTFEFSRADNSAIIQFESATGNTCFHTSV